MSKMPTWEEFMVSSLRVLSDGIARHRRDLLPLVGEQAQLTDEQLQATIPSGEYRYKNRIGFGLSFLFRVGALSRPARGTYQITDAGRQVLTRFPNGFTEREIKALGNDPDSGIQPYIASERTKSDSSSEEVDESLLTPLEQVQNGIERINDEVALELLERLQGKEPGFFEDAVVDLLLAMGYGGVNGRGRTTSRSNDGGIDGIIDQDVLGLSRVYIQAKRYADGNQVGRPEVQGFVGALADKADGGVFITTSTFSQGARDYAAGIRTRIILIDGPRLTNLMIKHGVGVQVKETYKVVEIDEDFFA